MRKVPPSASPVTIRSRLQARLRRFLPALAFAAIGGVAAAHATIVFGTLTTDPTPPRPDVPTAIELVMVDPVDAPVEDAIVIVEATGPDGITQIVTDPATETSPGAYRAMLVFPEAGTWTLLLRDQTFRQEEARATVEWQVGQDGDSDPVAFLFPPTATGPQSLTTWLVWLIGLPVVVGAIVTVMVLRSSGPAEVGAEAGAESGDEDDGTEGEDDDRP